MYKEQLTKRALKDALNVERAGLKSKAAEIIKTLRRDPYEESQNFERLRGNLKGACSRRLTRQHRFVYEVFPNTDNLKAANGDLYDGIVKIISMWTHYE